MPIDLDGLALIDTMLDSIIELRLMPIAWSEAQAKDLKIIHENVLSLNTLWAQADNDEIDSMKDALHYLRQPINATLGFVKVLQMGIYGQNPEGAITYLDTLEKNGKLLLQKHNYYSDKILQKLSR
jgi:hypothetical protein